jgi:endonuclease YncB( thermonuclease family)
MIPKQRFDEQQVIYAFTERIIDGDTIRVRHIPNYTWRHYLLRCFYNHQQTLQPLQQRGIAQETLSIRLYGIDCPELAKKKHQITQPFAEEAKAFTTQLCHHRVVKITLLRKDQYQRAVAIVEVVPNGWFRRRHHDLSMALAQAGLAELYTGGGAEYGNQRVALEHAIQQAQRKRKGIWSLSQRISAAEYKQTQKEATAVPQAPPKSQRAPPRRGSLFETAITGLELVG